MTPFTVEDSTGKVLLSVQGELSSPADVTVTSSVGSVFQRLDSTTPLVKIVLPTAETEKYTPPKVEEEEPAPAEEEAPAKAKK